MSLNNKKVGFVTVFSLFKDHTLYTARKPAWVVRLRGVIVATSVINVVATSVIKFEVQKLPDFGTVATSVI